VSPKLSLPAAALFVAAAALSAGPAPGPGAFPSFEKTEVDTSLRVGYAVLVADIDGDGRRDIVVVDTTRVVWYQNPTWKRRVITEGVTKPDNVSAAAYDIDGDGKLDLALAADWRPFNTKSGGTLQWLRRGKTLDEPWTVFPIGEEPTVHRIRFAPLDGSGKHALIAAPLMGRGSSAKNNWTDGSPVRLLAYRIPKDPTRDRWVPEVIDESLHVLHNFLPVSSWYLRTGSDFLTASYEGVSVLNHDPPRWTPHRLGAGNQENPAGSRGASEVREGRLKDGTSFIAAVEPWHGHQLVVYTPGADRTALWQRRVLDDRLKWGHAVWCADLDGDGSDEIVLGVRDNLSGKPGERCGVRVYRATGDGWKTWERHLIDEGGVAVEDLTAADLDGDGRTDLVAVGRQTHNLVIYRNAGKK
jgi:hypothetical protein